MAIRLLVVFVVVLSACQPSAPVNDDFPAESWRPLFNGENLEGWQRQNGTATYRVEDGAIVGRTAEGSPNSFLCTTEDYADFELTFDVRVDSPLNSGVQIRSRTKGAGTDDPGRVFGPQVEIAVGGPGGGPAGYIYGEATGHGWLTPDASRTPHHVLQANEWNSYRVVAQGPRIQTFINDEPIDDLTHEDIYESHPEGFICLQVHSIPAGSGPYEVRWRDIQLREVEG